MYLSKENCNIAIFFSMDTVLIQTLSYFVIPQNEWDLGRFTFYTYKYSI